MTKDKSGISRRRLIQRAAAGVAAGAIVTSLGKRVLAADAAKGAGVESTGATAKGAFEAKVVSVYSEKAFAGTSPDPAVVAEMLNKAAESFRGGSAAELWKSLFSQDDVVGIKLNCISRSVKPNKELIDAVVAGLKDAGVKENNIIVWDRFEDQLVRRARLKVNTGAEGVRIYGTEKPNDSLSGYDKDVYYESDADTKEYRSETGNRSLVSRIVTKDCTKIINMPVLKDHNVAGVSGCLKNLTFGAVNNTARFHKDPMYCSPAVPDIYALPPVRSKTVLHVLDALRVCYNGGPDCPNPAYIVPFSTIYLATDPVACDTIALVVVVRLRKEHGLPDLNETSGRPVHIADAAKKGLGVGERAKIERVEVTA
jgi:uncharacterized protein (DUF362 family)